MNFFAFILFIMLSLSFIPIVTIPYLTRKTESFGVTIPAQLYRSTIFKNMRKRYALILGSISLLFAITFLFFSWGRNESMIGVTFTIIILLYLILSFVIYLIFHFKMKKIKSASDWPKTDSETVMINTNFRKEKLNYSNRWFMISLLPSLAIILFTLQNYESLPNEIPLQFNFVGEATSTVVTSYRSSLMLPVMQIFITLLFAFINRMVARAKQQIDIHDAKQSMQRNAQFRRKWSLYLIVTGNATALLFFFMQLSLFYRIDMQIISIVALSLSILIIIGAIYLSFKTGQGGSRINQSNGTNEDNKINRDDDKHWKLGIFYFNKQDPTLFLEKRFGIGWTINLARPLTWVILLSIILFSVLLPYLVS